VAQEIELHGDVLRALFDRYLLTGGYPHAMSAEQQRGTIPRGIYQLYLTTMTNQMRRAKYSEGSFREVVAWAAHNRFGQEFSWHDVAGETDIGSKDTARRYIEDAERLFLWHVLYRTRDMAASAPAFRSPKKLYPHDPFSWHVLASWVAGDAEPWAGSIVRLGAPEIRGRMVECVAGDHLIRGFGRFAFYHRTSEGDEEIDLVLHRGGAQARVEIKYRGKAQRKFAKYLGKHGGGILATLDHLHYDAELHVAHIPLYAVLAGYAEPITLYPAHP
jgi:predicted AAA+ superfamily ATPase